jgi:hypothetical protein
MLAALVFVVAVSLAGECPLDGDALPPEDYNTPDFTNDVTPIFPTWAQINGHSSVLCNISTTPQFAPISPSDCFNTCVLMKACKSFAHQTPDWPIPDPTDPELTVDSVARCVLYDHVIDFGGAGDNVGVDGSMTYFVMDRETEPELPVIEFTVVPVPSDPVPTLYHTETVVITASLSRSTGKDVAILFQMGGNARRGQDYHTSFPATNLVQISKHSLSASWTITNKIAKLTGPQGGTKDFTVSPIFVTNARATAVEGDDFVSDPETFAFTFLGGKRPV